MKQTFQKIFSLFLCGILVLGLIAGAIPALAETEISSVSVTVTAPTAGASSESYPIAGDSSYIVEGIQWYLGDTSVTEAFVGGQTYRVKIDLKATEGYTFSSAVSGKINGNICQVEKVEAQSRIRLIYDFYVEPADSTITSVAVTGLNTPIASAAGDLTAEPAGSGYRVQEVAWYHADGNKMQANEVFTGGKQYTVSIVLAAEAGYSFATSLSGKINGTPATCSVANGTVTLEYTYAVTELDIISSASITGLTSPEEGNTPDFSVTAPANAKYTVQEVVWLGKKTDSSSAGATTLNQDSQFAPGYSYQVRIKLKAKGEALFGAAGAFTASINGETAQFVKLSEPAPEIEIGFTYTLDGEKIPIDTVTVTGITKPSIGKKPVTTGEVPDEALYTIDKVIWKKLGRIQSTSAPTVMGPNEKFEQSNNYQVVVILKANEGAAFTLNEQGQPLIKAILNETAGVSVSVVEDKKPAEYISISCDFQTAAELIDSVSILELDEPIKGEHADKELKLPDNALYEIAEDGVIWRWRDPSTPNSKYKDMIFSDVFEYDKEYQICVILKAKEDSEFSTNAAGQPQVTVKFNNEPAKPAAEVKDKDAAQYIQVTFEFLLESDIKTIEQVEVHEIAQPIAGNLPDMEASVSFVAKYTVESIAWEKMQNDKAVKLKEQDAFQSGETYRVTIVLKAKENAVFDVDSVGRTRVRASLNGEAVHASAVSGKDAKEYIALVREFNIYTVIEGDGSQWTPQKESLRFRFSGARDNFRHLEVDGIEVNSKYYTISQDSVVIQLDSSFISALKDGTHTLTAVYTDGAASTQFQVDHNGTVQSAQEKKGNDGLWLLIIPLLVVLIAGGIAIYIFLYKKGWV